jgi:NAD(P)-dependent dehydrogenase (short-subunit alcohol dehydrogenase family)
MSARFRLDGKVALVTGASSGLGAHFARLLAAEGAQVALLARRLDRIEAGVQAIVADGGTAWAWQMDVTDARSVADAVASVAAAYGRIDVLINNAGIAATRPFLEQDEEGWRTIIDTNLSGMMRAGREVAKRMAAQGQGGSIVNVASILGLRTAAQLAPYAAAKAGVISLTQTMALELARHAVRVNALAPGYVETDLNRDFLRGPAGQSLVKRVPLRRFGEASDLDGALLLLASDAGRFVTGITLPVDGGHLLSFL